MISLLTYKPIKFWTPKIGDEVFHNGWFVRWVGVINGITPPFVSIIQAGSVTELLSYTSKQQDKNTIKINIDDIIASNGKYEIRTTNDGGNIWYV